MFDKKIKSLKQNIVNQNEFITNEDYLEANRYEKAIKKIKKIERIMILVSSTSIFLIVCIFGLIISSFLD